jgi:maltokinase
VGEQLDGTTPGFAAGPAGITAASYPSDERLLAELRAGWPPAPLPDDERRGDPAVELAAVEPAAALRLGDRFAIALVPAADGAFLVAPLARDEILATTWRLARPGDGLSAFVAGAPVASERAIEADQTNTSVVVGERAIVKWFQRVGPGPSRAATLIAHLDAVGFAEIPSPLGSIAWQTPAGVALTVAQGDAFLPGARDGWDWCVARLERHVAHGETDCPDGCDPWIGARLGGLLDRLHTALARPSGVIGRPAGSVGPATIAAWQAGARRTIDAALALADDRAGGEPGSAAFLGSIAEALFAAIEIAPGRDQIAVQPVHGDLHVGQILEWTGGLAVIDFDGNPTLGDDANALRQPVERDIAQMTMSLDHVGRIVDRRTSGTANVTIEAWIRRNRRDFLGELGNPPDPVLLAAFEIEQECRELVYAARFLPRWRYAPLAALRARYAS